MPARKTKNLIKVPDAPIKLKYKDIFDLSAFYEACFYFLREYGWYATTGSPDDDAHTYNEAYETHYFEQHLPGGVKNITYYWRLQKPAPDGSMLHYHFDFNVQIIALGNTEIIRDGNKIKANKGEIGMEMVAYIEEKYKSELGGKRWFKPIQDIFNKRIYKSTIDQRKRELYREVYVFQNFIKQWFKLKRYLPYEETKSFYPSSAWPSHHREK